jgi:hypothetical protein
MVLCIDQFQRFQYPIARIRYQRSQIDVRHDAENQYEDYQEEREAGHEHRFFEENVPSVGLPLVIHLLPVLKFDFLYFGHGNSRIICFLEGTHRILKVVFAPAPIFFRYSTGRQIWFCFEVCLK